MEKKNEIDVTEEEIRAYLDMDPNERAERIQRNLAEQIIRAEKRAQRERAERDPS